MSVSWLGIVHSSRTTWSEKDGYSVYGVHMLLRNSVEKYMWIRVRMRKGWFLSVHAEKKYSK